MATARDYAFSCLYEDAASLVAFFGKLASDWRGWSGVHAWESLEGELSLQASADRLGHITLRVGLRSVDPPTWAVDAALELDAGGLDRVAKAVQAIG